MQTLIATAAVLFVIGTGCTVGQSRRDPEQQRQAFLQKCLDIAAENIANSDTNADVKGLNNPYRRKIVRWQSAARTWSVVEDASPFSTRFEPGNPLADAAGIVRYPNVVVRDEVAAAEAAAQELRRLLAARAGRGKSDLQQ